MIRRTGKCPLSPHHTLLNAAQDFSHEISKLRVMSTRERRIRRNASGYYMLARYRMRTCIGLQSFAYMGFYDG